MQGRRIETAKSQQISPLGLQIEDSEPVDPGEGWGGGKERVGRMQRAAWKRACYHTRNREPVALAV